MVWVCGSGDAMVAGRWCVPVGASRHRHNKPLTGLDAPLMVTPVHRPAIVTAGAACPPLGVCSGGDSTPAEGTYDFMAQC